MDDKTYTAITELCARLAGRMSDDSLSAVRDHYAAGEWGLGDDTLLLNLAYQVVGITPEERESIRSFLGDPDNPDLLQVPAIADAPSPSYRFSPTGPGNAADPSHADRILTAESTRRGANRLYRAWREPSPGAPGGATWVYLLTVPAGTDQLKTYSALTSRLWTEIEEKWQLEVVAEGAPLPPYQAAAAAAAQPVRTP